MKKLLFIGIAAATMLASCSNDETLEMVQPKAIGFGDTFVNNGIRSAYDASLTKDKLSDFAVYGFTNKGQIFDNVKVSRTALTEPWTYSPIQYWVAGNTYKFAALAPYSVAGPDNVTNIKCDKGISMEVDFTNFSGDQDLLYAVHDSIVIDHNSYLANINKVNLMFKHQISKVKFSFKNLVGEGYNVKVSDVNITDAYDSGILSIAEGATEGTWKLNNYKTTTIEFNNVLRPGGSLDDPNNMYIPFENKPKGSTEGLDYETYYEKLLIPSPASSSYNVTFTAELYFGKTLKGTFNHKATIKDVELKLGYCYDFLVTLTSDNIDPQQSLKEIEFDVEKVEDWNKEEQQFLPLHVSNSNNSQRK